MGPGDEVSAKKTTTKNFNLKNRSQISENPPVDTLHSYALDTDTLDSDTLDTDTLNTDTQDTEILTLTH